jgi:hypothetical protein
MNTSSTNSGGITGMLTSLGSSAKNLTRKLSNVGSSLVSSPVPNSPTVTSGPGVNASMKGGRHRRSHSHSRRTRKRTQKRNTTRKNRCWSRK